MATSEQGHRWQTITGDALDAAALHQALKLRSEVFVAEQASAYQDVDGRDLLPDTLHLFGTHGPDLLAYGRLLGPHTAADAVHLGRVVVAPIARGRGLGDALVSEALRRAREHWPGRPIALEAQSTVVSLYERYGFTAVGDPFDDAGIEHQRMELASPAEHLRTQ